MQILDSGGGLGSYRIDGYYYNGAQSVGAVPSTWWSSDTTMFKGLLPTTVFSVSGYTYRMRGVLMYEYVATTGYKVIYLYYGTQSGQCGRGTLADTDQSNNPLNAGLCLETVFSS